MCDECVAVCAQTSESACACECVCACVRERDREVERESAHECVHALAQPMTSSDLATHPGARPRRPLRLGPPLTAPTTGTEMAGAPNRPRPASTSRIRPARGPREVRTRSAQGTAPARPAPARATPHALLATVGEAVLGHDACVRARPPAVPTHEAAACSDVAMDLLNGDASEASAVQTAFLGPLAFALTE